MPHQLYFIADNQVPFIKIIGDYKLEDARTVCQDVANFMDTTDKNCYLLADLRLMRAMPTNIVQMREATRPMFTHPRFKMLVSYGLRDAMVINFMARTLASLFVSTVQTFVDEQSAVKYILAHAPHLAGTLSSDLMHINNETALY